MRKNTRNNLTKKIANYGALTLAITGTTNVYSQIEYNDITDFIGGTNSDYYLDLDGDGYYDFRIVNRNGPYNSGGNNLYIEPWSYNNSVLGSPGGIARAYPFVLNSDSVISSGGNINSSTTAFWLNRGYYSNNWSSLNYGNCLFNGRWCNINDGYLGLRFNVGTPSVPIIKYGWVRLDVDQYSTTYTIKDYAYNNDPGQPINAGQKSLGIEDNIFIDIRIVALNNRIGLYNLKGSTNYSIFGITGQKVLEGNTDLDTFVIEATNLSSGIYIVELTDLNSKAIIRKKIVLH